MIFIKYMCSILSVQKNMLIGAIQNKNFWLILVIDILLIIMSHYVSYAIRFDFLGHGHDHFVTTAASFIPLIISVKILIFYIFGLYRGMWRYTNFDDIVNILFASLLSAIVLVFVIFFYNRFEGLPRSIFLLDFIITFLLISLHRASIRFFYQKLNSNFDDAGISAKNSKNKKRILLVGAGDEAEKIIRELHQNQGLPYTILGLLDTNPKNIGYKLHGKPVLGLVKHLPMHVQQTQAQEILAPQQNLWVALGTGRSPSP